MEGLLREGNHQEPPLAEADAREQPGKAWEEPLGTLLHQALHRTHGGGLEKGGGGAGGRGEAEGEGGGEGGGGGGLGGDGGETSGTGQGEVGMETEGHQVMVVHCICEEVYTIRTNTRKLMCLTVCVGIRVC